MSKPPPKSPSAAADHAYEELVSQMLRGTLAPGTRIVERDIVERLGLGLSRTPVRQAVSRLQSEGLLIANTA